MAVNPNVIGSGTFANNAAIDKTLPDHDQISRIVGNMLVAEGVVNRQTVDDTLALLQGKNRENTVFLVLEKHGLLTRGLFLDVIRKRQPDLPLGMLLTELGLIDQSRLQQLLEQQAHDYYQNKLGELLVSNGLLKEQELTEIVAAQIGLESEEPRADQCDEDILKTIVDNTCQRFSFVPIRRDADRILVIFADPLDQQARTAAARMLGCAIEAKMASKTTIDRILQYVTNPLTVNETSESGLNDLPASFLNSLIADGLSKGASHVHIEPGTEHSRILMRIEGRLVEFNRLNRTAHSTLVARVKTRINVDSTIRNKHHSGCFEHTNAANEVEASVNVSVLASKQGDSIVLGIDHCAVAIPTLEELHLKSSDRKAIRRSLDRMGGIVIFTGTAESGMSQTLYSAIQYLNQTGKKVVSIEDSIKTPLDGVVQCDLNAHDGTKASLKFALSHDPDVLVLSEMKDDETALSATDIALTGTKVLTTCRTEDCLGVLNQINDINKQMLRHSSTDITLIAQRLLRRVCSDCAADLPVNKTELTDLGWTDTSQSIPSFLEGRGCTKCQHTGYHGRVALFEVAAITEDVRRDFADRVTSAELRDTMKQAPGYTSIKESAFLAAIEGVTTLDEVKRHFSNAERVRPLNDLLDTE